jgi:hypothetical protein
MSNIIFPNTIFGLKCLGANVVPAHQFLSGEATPFTLPFPLFGGHGHTIHGILFSLSLVADMTPAGATWLALDAGSSRFRFSCFADIFLQGNPTNNQVSIVSKGQADSPQSVTIWEVIDLPDGHVMLRCDGQKFLNGKTVEGSLTLEADNTLSGTRWEKVPVGPPGEPTPVPHPDM